VLNLADDLNSTPLMPNSLVLEPPFAKLPVLPPSLLSESQFVWHHTFLDRLCLEKENPEKNTDDDRQETPERLVR